MLLIQFPAVKYSRVASEAANELDDRFPFPTPSHTVIGKLRPWNAISRGRGYLRIYMYRKSQAPVRSPYVGQLFKQNKCQSEEDELSSAIGEEIIQCYKASAMVRLNCCKV